MAPPAHIARENGRKGGRPPGVVDAKTLAKRRVEAAIRERIQAMAEKLIESQSIAAIGTHKVIVMNRDAEGIMHVETIRDIKRIESLLATGIYGQDYLIVAGAEPDWKAANALLDRAFGKAKESIEHSGEVKFSLKQLAERRKDAVIEAHAEEEEPDQPVIANNVQEQKKEEEIQIIKAEDVTHQ